MTDPERLLRERAPGFPTETFYAEQYIGRLEDLIRWLALPYDGRTPIFPSTDMYTGEPMAHAGQLENTWAAVIGDTGPPAPGRWVRCAVCRSAYVDSQNYE